MTRNEINTLEIRYYAITENWKQTIRAKSLLLPLDPFLSLFDYLVRHGIAPDDIWAHSFTIGYSSGKEAPEWVQDILRKEIDCLLELSTQHPLPPPARAGTASP